MTTTLSTGNIAILSICVLSVSLTQKVSRFLNRSGPNFSDTYRRSLAIHMRTNKSAPTAESAGAGLCAFLHDIDGANPVVYGRDAFVAEHRDGLLAPAAASSAKL